MNCKYAKLRDIIIPLMAALIGGSTTLFGVILTIRHENKNSEKSYIEKIRPFFVIESYPRTNIDLEKVKAVYISDDSDADLNATDVVFHWNGLLLSNVSDAVCILDYIKIDKTIYETSDNLPIKSGESFSVMGFPLSSYVRGKNISHITIGVLDRLFNRYEYELAFQLQEAEADKRIKKENMCKSIEFTAIDCSKNVFDKKEYEKNYRFNKR